MLQFPGNVQLAANILDWLSPRPAPRASCCCAATRRCSAIRSRSSTTRAAARSAARSPTSTRWLGERDEWLLTPAAMKAWSPRARGRAARCSRWSPCPSAAVRRSTARGCASAGRRAATSHTRWSRGADAAHGSLLVLACILRDQVAARCSRRDRRAPEPLYTCPEAELVAQLHGREGHDGRRSRSRASTSGCARCPAAVRPPRRGAPVTCRGANSTRYTRTSPSCVVLSVAELTRAR